MVTAIQRYASDPMMIPVKMAAQVDAPDLTVDRAAGYLWIAPRHDVAAHAAVRGDDHATGERDDVAADPAGDAGVAVHDDHATGDPATHDEVALAHDHVVGDGSHDADVAVGGRHGPVHQVTARDVDVAGDADDAIADRAPTCPRGREGRCRHRGGDDERERDDGDNTATHATPSGTRTAQPRA